MGQNIVDFFNACGFETNFMSFGGNQYRLLIVPIYDKIHKVCFCEGGQ